MALLLHLKRFHQSQRFLNLKQDKKFKNLIQTLKLWDQYLIHKHYVFKKKKKNLQVQLIMSQQILSTYFKDIKKLFLAL